MIQVIFKCNGIIVNEHADRNGFFQDTVGEIPLVGDFVELGGHTKEWDSWKDPTPMVKYQVTSRTFSAIENYNNTYSDKKCVIEVIQVENV